MSQERDVVNIDGSAKPIEMNDQQYEAYIAEVLNRDLLADQLKVNLPDDIHGEWVADNPVSITNKKLLGYKIDDKYAAGNALHSDGSGAPRVGDVIFMTIPKARQRIIEKQRQKKYDSFHAVRKSPDGSSTTPEERKFLEDTERNVMPAISQGKTKTVNVATSSED